MLFTTVLLQDDVSSTTGIRYDEWQQRLIRLFSEELSPEGKENLRHGVIGNNEVILEIRFERFHHGNFNVSALPNSVRRIVILHCSQTFQISTRSLPKSLKIIRLNLNQIHGRIDLTTLPSRLEKAVFGGNRMKGPISLTSLPPTLKDLCLFNNRIEQAIVWYSNLPEGIQSIRLFGQTKGKGVGEVRALHENEAIANKAIFGGIPANHVH
mmetsp:Transcript_18163/g.28447  ORF Transcript_18163/g.28447 Transcript_18163/m.28447 type:complete len:211 (-) Transcript_18163:234-866(-)